LIFADDEEILGTLYFNCGEEEFDFTFASEILRGSVIWSLARMISEAVFEAARLDDQLSVLLTIFSSDLKKNLPQQVWKYFFSEKGGAVDRDSG
jgi:hypothetical protein